MPYTYDDGSVSYLCVTVALYGAGEVEKKGREVLSSYCNLGIDLSGVLQYNKCQSCLS